MCPDNLAVWPMATAAITMRTEITPKILARRMSSVPALGTACLVASFLNVATELFISFHLIGIQHLANLSLRIFFDSLNLRTGFSPELSYLPAAFVEDFIDALTLFLGETEIVVNPVYISNSLGGSAALIAEIRRTAGNARLIE